MTTITTPPDRSAEQPAEPCARHKVAAIIIVRAELCEGTTAAHLIEYVTAQLANREPDLHEDIWDELEGVTMDVEWQEETAKEEKHTLGCALACARWFSEGNKLCSTCPDRRIKADEGTEAAA